MPARDDAILVRFDLPRSGSPRPPPLVLGHEGQFRALVERAADVVIVLSIDGRWRYLSPNAWSVLGLRGERILGLTNVDVVLPTTSAASSTRSSRCSCRAGPGSEL